MKYITRNLILSAVVSRKMDTNDPQQLEKLKDRLKDRMGIPVGWHMSGIPLVGAMILSMFAFAPGSTLSLVGGVRAIWAAAVCRDGGDCACIANL